jgi:predicted ATPase
MREYFTDGVCFVSLSTISDPGLVMPSIGQELGIQDASKHPLLGLLKAYLRDKHLFLLLDNFEQVVVAAPGLSDLLSACPHLKILVTSRAVLHLSGEYVYPVPPLALPELKHLPVSDALSRYAGVALFLQRAQAGKPDFQLMPTNAQTIAEVCVHLDGLPLAIELAAARVKLLSPQALLARLGQRLQVLTSGAQDAPVRQQTLRNTLQWSYDLLNANEQRLFRRLSVFVGGWTLEAVEAVCYYDMQEEQVFALDEVASLLDKSLLLQVERADKELRLHMLMTVREYGLECLRESGEAEQTHQAHALYYLALAEEAEKRQSGGEQALWLDRLEREHDNFRAALRWLSERQESELTLRLGGALYWFWSVREYINEGYLWLKKALAGTEGVMASVRVKALNNAGALGYNLGTYDDQVEALFQESLALSRQFGDIRGCATALYWLGQLACWTKCDYSQARAFAKESLKLYTAVNDKSGIADSLMVIGYTALNQGNYSEARLFLEQGAACFREVDDYWGMAYSLQYVARVLLELGDYELARTAVEESLAISNELDYKGGIATALGLKGHLALKQGDTATARVLIEESLVRHQERKEQSGKSEALFLLARVSQAEGKYTAARTLYEECLALIEKQYEQGMWIHCMEGLGAVALAQGSSAWAVLLWGAAAQLRKVQGVAMSPLARNDYDQAMATACKQLGEKMFASLWERGYAMTPEQALTPPGPTTESIHLLTAQLAPIPSSSSTYSASLTRREVDVLRLVAQGLKFQPLFLSGCQPEACKALSHVMLLAIQPAGHLSLRMAVQPAEHYLVEALLYGHPGDRISLSDSTTKELHGRQLIGMLSILIRVDFAYAALCKLRYPQSAKR